MNSRLKTSTFLQFGPIKNTVLITALYLLPGKVELDVLLKTRDSHSKLISVKAKREGKTQRQHSKCHFTFMKFLNYQSGNDC